MQIEKKTPPRKFVTGISQITISDCARLELAPDEQVTFTTEAGGEYDVARKSWGFYATPSLNSRLQNFNLRGVLAKNPQERFFVFLVERGKESDFEQYLSAEQMQVVSWLDTTESLQALERGIQSIRSQNGE